MDAIFYFSNYNTHHSSGTLSKMSQDPKTKISSRAVDFTPTIHHDTYDYINPEQFDLNGRTVFVTGASKGIGRDTCIGYARAGASNIALGARSDMSGLVNDMKEAAKKAGKKEPNILSIKLDVSDQKSVDDAAKQIEKEFGELDIVINNAGYLEQFNKIAESDPADWWKVWEVNIKGPYLVARATIPLLVKKNQGLKTILNVSSVGAHWLLPGASGYQIGKLALIRFGEFINTEYGEEGIISYAIHPGGIPTELAKGMPEYMHEVLSDTPALAGDSFVWLTAERREWLAGRYVDATWDMRELLEKRESIKKGDLLRIRLDVGQ